MQKVINVLDLKISNDLPLLLIAGPCQMESRDHAFDAMGFLSNLTQKLNIPFIFKTSFDKANRTSANAKRGLGLEKAIDVFIDLKKHYNHPIITDVHESYQCDIAAEAVDVLQIPAFLCRQTDLLIAAAKTGKAANVKKGQFLAPWEMQNVVTKLESVGCTKIMLTERGTSFGYNMLINDMRALPIMKETGYPVIFDATHSVMKPGAAGDKSSGERKYVETLAIAAVSLGVAGLFVETHRDPDNAPSDGPNMLRFEDLERVLNRVMQFDHLAKEKSLKTA
jgi:2-dehydro-3-deoxyphosphooctonate aldolase (KDO 8-P synthase)